MIKPPHIATLEHPRLMLLRSAPSGLLSGALRLLSAAELLRSAPSGLLSGAKAPTIESSRRRKVAKRIVAKRIVILAALMWAVPAQAQVLYQISGNSASAKSYLLATNRFVDQAFIDTIPNVFHCYGACDKVITEFAMQDYEAIAALRQAAILPDSVKLINFYTEKQYTDLDVALHLTLGMGLDQLCRMKPSYLTEMYRVELFKKWLEYDESRSMETFFENVASQTNIPIYGLDNVGETMYMLFDREPFHWQCEELIKVIDNPEREVNLERAIRSAYLMGRLNDIAYQVEAPDNTSSLSYSDYQVYCQRNIEWVKRLRPFLKDGHAFITLNAIYLGGDKGLIALLRKEGYKVKPVNTGWFK